MREDNFKIAVQLYGHLRTFEACADNLKSKLLDKYQCDVFIHTWDTLDHDSPTWHRQYSSTKSVPFKTKLIDRLLQCYEPKEFLIEQQNFLSRKGLFGSTSNNQISLVGIEYMLYSQNQVNEMRIAYERTHFSEYDYVIMLRPDIRLLEDFHLEHYLPEFKVNNFSSVHLIHQLELKKHDSKLVVYPKMADLFFLATPEVMNLIALAYCSFADYYIDRQKIFNLSISSPEVAFLDFIESQKISPKYYQFNFELTRFDEQKNIKLRERFMLTQVVENKLKVFIKMIYRALPSGMRSFLSRISTLLFRVVKYLDFLEQSR